MTMTETEYGFEIRHENFLIFFGKKNSSYANLTQAYPHFNFKRLKQIHSDAVHETNSDTPDLEILGDAHTTGSPGITLCSITADCIPVMIADTNNNICAAIHAGWRGVASKIIPKTIENLFQQGSLPAHLKIFIGPHIQQSSFEIGNDVRDSILASLGALSSSEKIRFFKPSATDKSLLDLNLVARRQILSLEIPEEHIWDIRRDTYTSEQFHSYRRDKTEAGRQISFICKMK